MNPTRSFVVSGLAAACLILSLMSPTLSLAQDVCSQAASPPDPFRDMLSRVNAAGGIIATVPGGKAASIKKHLGKAEKKINDAIKACDIATNFKACIDSGGGSSCAYGGAEDSLCALGDFLGLSSSDPFSLLNSVAGGVMSNTQKFFSLADMNTALLPSFNPLCKSSYDNILGDLVCGKPVTNTIAINQHTNDGFEFSGGCPTCFDPDDPPPGQSSGWTQPICKDPPGGVLGKSIRPAVSPYGQSCQHFRQCTASPPVSQTPVEKAARLNEAFKALREAYKDKLRSPGSDCGRTGLIDLGTFQGCVGSMNLAENAAPFTPIRTWVPAVPRANRRSKYDEAYIDQLATNAALRLMMGIPDAGTRFSKIMSYDWSPAEVNAELFGPNPSYWTLQNQMPIVQARFDSYYSQCASNVLYQAFGTSALLLVEGLLGNNPNKVYDGCHAGSAPKISSFELDVDRDGLAVASLVIENESDEPLFAIVDWGNGAKLGLVELELSKSGEVQLTQQVERADKYTVELWVMDYSGLVVGADSRFVP